MESAMTAILRDATGKMHHGILFDPPLGGGQAQKDGGATGIMPSFIITKELTTPQNKNIN